LVSINNHFKPGKQLPVPSQNPQCDEWKGFTEPQKWLKRGFASVNSCVGGRFNMFFSMFTSTWGNDDPI